MTAEQTLGPGSRLGRYRIERELGRGAMGAVLLAEDTVLRQRVCVKILHDAFLHHPEASARFTREIVLARRISHPGICRLHDLHDEGGRRFLTMEYVEGTPLRELVGKDADPLPVVRAVRITRNVCRALAAAHAVGVIHRDLKPRNIMLRSPETSTEPDDVCILDFGIATADDTAGEALTRPGYALGTRHYIAPEVWMGEQASARSDLFGVGVLFFNLLVARMPWSMGADGRLLERMRAAPAPAPSTLRSEIPPSVDSLVAAALAFDAQKRVADAATFAASCDDVLRALAGDEPPWLQGQPTVVQNGFSLEATLPETPALRRSRDPDAADAQPTAPYPAPIGALPPIASTTTKPFVASPAPKPPLTSPATRPTATTTTKPPVTSPATKPPVTTTTKPPLTSPPPRPAATSPASTPPASSPPARTAQEVAPPVASAARAGDVEGTDLGFRIDDVSSVGSASWVVGGQPVDLPLRPLRRPGASDGNSDGNSDTEVVVRSLPAAATMSPNSTPATASSRTMRLVVGAAVVVVVGGGVVVAALAARGVGPAATSDVEPAPSGPPAMTADGGASASPGVVAEGAARSAPGEASAPPAPAAPADVVAEGAARSAPGEASAPPAAAAPADVVDPDDAQFAWSRAQASLEAAMKRRGLADGDDAALDQSVGAAREAAAARRFDDAIQHADDARLRAVAVVVDKGFVQQKLARVNTRYDATPPSGARDRATASLQRATDELRKGRLELANRALNDCLALLTGG